MKPGRQEQNTHLVGRSGDRGHGELADTAGLTQSKPTAAKSVDARVPALVAVLIAPRAIRSLQAARIDNAIAVPEG
jgi:hypothetical protein